jgi:hypothetical protein
MMSLELPPIAFDPSKYPNARIQRPRKGIPSTTCIRCKKAGYRYYFESHGKQYCYYKHLDEPPIGYLEKRNVFRYRMCQVLLHDNIPLLPVIDEEEKKIVNVESKQCVTCGSETTYMKKNGKPHWYTVNEGYQCLVCYRKQYKTKQKIIKLQKVDNRGRKRLSRIESRLSKIESSISKIEQFLSSFTKK